MAHAYWEINTEGLKQFDKGAIEHAVRALQVALAEYVLEQEKTWRRNKENFSLHFEG
jgi:hypothetical protein